MFNKRLKLTAIEIDLLAGSKGPASQFAMQMLVKLAHQLDADQFIDVSQAHLVGSYHSGPANIELLQIFAKKHARVVIPTTLSSCAADLTQIGYNQQQSQYCDNASVVEFFNQMGCDLALTCAPYHLSSPPKFGECIAWAESNAVVYANSVLGARTNMTYQYVDLCAALTGRIPLTGLYLDANRAATMHCQLVNMPINWLTDDTFYQLLGAVIATKCQDKIPLISGIPTTVTDDQLRALGASGAAYGQLKMFHVLGVTPEANTFLEASQGNHTLTTVDICPQNILTLVQQLNSTYWQQQSQVTTPLPVDAICLGAPHFSLPEFTQLVRLLNGRKINSQVDFIVTTSRHVFAQIQDNGVATQLHFLGVQVVVDTCSYYPSVLAKEVKLVMTNSLKWCYYGPGNLNVTCIFAQLQQCIASAITGRLMFTDNFWQGYH